MSGRSGKKKMSKLSRSARAGVIFPVGRLMRYLKKGTFKYRISVGAPVYMAAVIEYLAGNVNPRCGQPTPRPTHTGWEGCCGWDLGFSLPARLKSISAGFGERSGHMGGRG